MGGKMSWRVKHQKWSKNYQRWLNLLPMKRVTLGYTFCGHSEVRHLSRFQSEIQENHRIPPHSNQQRKAPLPPRSNNFHWAVWENVRTGSPQKQKKRKKISAFSNTSTTTLPQTHLPVPTRWFQGTCSRWTSPENGRARDGSPMF